MKLLAQDIIGTITPPSGTVPQTSDPAGFVTTVVRQGIWLLIIVSFIVALIWMIFAGYGLIFAGDDPKKVASSWTRIYMGLLGLVIIVGAFAIINLVETFFGITIIKNVQIPVLTR